MNDFNPVTACVICQAPIRAGSHPPVCGEDCRRELELECAFNRWARDQADQSLARRVRSAVQQACIRLGEPCYSTHGFRRTFAQERYRNLRAEGLDDRAARRALAGDLGHNRIDVTYSYVPRQ